MNQINKHNQNDLAKQEFILIIATNIDDDDFEMLFESIRLKTNILLLTDEFSITNYQGSIKYIVDEFKNPNLAIEKIKAWLEKSNSSIKNIIGLDEEHHYNFSYEIAKAFNIPFHSKDVINSASNKYLQLEKLHKAKIPCPDFEIIKLDETNIKTNISFPNVIKMITGYASEYVYLNKNISELQEHIATIKEQLDFEIDPMINIHKFNLFGKEKTINPKNEFLIQSLAKGTEYSCDYFVLPDGSVKILRVVEKIKIPDKFPAFKGFYLFNPDKNSHKPFKVNELENLCKAIADALEIKSGVSMMDFFCHNNKFCVIETSIRPGISTFVELMSDIYKTTSIELLFNNQLSQESDLQILEINKKINQEIKSNYEIPKETGLAVYFSTNKAGTIQEFNTDKLNSLFENKIIKIKKFYEVGETITLKENGVRLTGFVLIKDIKYEEINSQIALIEQSIKFDIQP